MCDTIEENVSLRPLSPCLFTSLMTTSTWNSQTTSASTLSVILNCVSQNTKVFDLHIDNHYHYITTLLCVVDQLGPVSAQLSLCWAEVLHFSAGERGLINLTVERQHRCAGNKAAGHRY